MLIFPSVKQDGTLYVSHGEDQVLAHVSFPSAGGQFTVRDGEGPVLCVAFARWWGRWGAANLRSVVHSTVREWRTKVRPDAALFAMHHLHKDWTVMDRLGQMTVPTLVMAGQADFLFPPELQRQLADAIPNARLKIIPRAGHNPHDEQPAEVLAAIRAFLSTTLTSAGGPVPRLPGG